MGRSGFFGGQMFDARMSLIVMYDPVPPAPPSAPAPPSPRPEAGGDGGLLACWTSWQRPGASWKYVPDVAEAPPSPPASASGGPTTVKPSTGSSFRISC